MKENNPHILGEAPIGKLLVEYSIPAIIGMTLTHEPIHKQPFAGI